MPVAQNIGLGLIVMKTQRLLMPIEPFGHVRIESLPTQGKGQIRFFS